MSRSCTASSRRRSSRQLGAARGADGFAEPVDREHCAYVFLLRDADQQLLGAVGVVCRESSQRGDSRPISLVQGLLRPALECLQRELGAQYSIGDLQRSLMVRDRDLELLLGAAHEEAAGAETTDDFAQLVQGCVEHLGCSVGALLIPDKNIAVCRTGPGTPPARARRCSRARTGTCSAGPSCTARR